MAPLSTRTKKETGKQQQSDHNAKHSTFKKYKIMAGDHR
jgi:hypothetical protein